MKKFFRIAYLVVTLFFLGNILFSHMNLNPIYPETAFFYCVVVTVYLGLHCLRRMGAFIVSRQSGAVSVNYERNGVSIPKWTLVVAGICWGAYLVVSVGSTVIFNVNAYRNQMPNFREGEFNADVQLVDTTQLPVVDREMAKKLADKKLGENPSLGSQVVLGEPTVQMVDGELVWVAPTYHSGFFKWITNLSGSQGYVIVSATNPQDVRYVDSHRIKIQPGAYLFDGLSFYARFFGAPFTGLTDYSFELDDEGNPYWVISTYRNTWGFRLPEATGALIINAETGARQKYTLSNLPEWVDRVQPEDFIIQQIDNKGQYINGFLNFADKDKYKTSPGDIIVYNNGDCYLFTGITSVGADESAIGFVMVDMVTKEPTIYRISGATEQSAQKSAEGKVQQFGYYASWPIIVNVNGTPSYFMTLKDDEGLLKQYAYVSVKDYLVVGVGESVPEAKVNYEKALRQNVSNDTTIAETTAKTASGTVQRISAEYNTSGTVYRFVLEGRPDKLFTAAASLSEELAITREGDSVRVEYLDNGAGLCEVTGFDNLAFEQK